MKYSRQRELILNTVVQNPIHPTADEVYSMVRQSEPNISLGTIYRNLNLLSDQGYLQKISMPETSDHFDGRTDSHHHLLCEKCGKLSDIGIGSVEELEQGLKQLTDVQVTGYRIFVTGVCQNCLTIH